MIFKRGDLLARKIPNGDLALAEGEEELRSANVREDVGEGTSDDDEGSRRRATGNSRGEGMRTFFS